MDCKRPPRSRSASFSGRAVPLALLTLAATSLASLAQPAASPRKVVSINLCTDQLLLALAAPVQVVALSRLGRHRDLSFLARDADRFAVLSGRAEDVLIRAPDLVLAGAFSAGETRAFLVRSGLRVETFTPVQTLADARAEIVRAAALLHRPERGDELLARIATALDRSREAGRGLTAIAYERRGYVAADGTLLDELMAHVGLENLARSAGLRGVSPMSLEAIVASPPDVLILDWKGEAPPDQGTALLRHPALARAIPPERQIVLPAPLVTCAGPALPQAIERLAGELRRIRAGSGR